MTATWSDDVSTEPAGSGGTGPEPAGSGGTGPEPAGSGGTGPEPAGSGGTGTEPAGSEGTGTDSSGVRPVGRTPSVRIALAVLLGVAAVMVAIDQWTKQLALDALSDGAPVRTLGGLIYLDLTFNAGAAFSFGTRFTWVFPVIAIVVSGVILWIARRLRSWPWAIALGLVLGGAVGNLVDRLFREPGPFRGHVVDFISALAPAGEKFAIFNIADSSLTVGVVLALALELFGLGRDGTRAVADRDQADRGPHAPGSA